MPLSNCIVYKKAEVGVLKTEIAGISKNNGVGLSVGRAREIHDIAASNYKSVSGNINVLPRNEQREYLLIQNFSVTEIWVNFNRPAGVNDGFKIFPDGGFLEWFDKVPIGAIYVFASVAGLDFVIGEA